MNLDELVASIADVKLQQDLSHWIELWKRDDKDIDDLAYMIGKWHGNVWFQDATTSNKFHDDFQEFKKTAIEGIGGLTVNERLYWFGLFDIWDSGNEATHSRIRNKLHAQV